MKVLSAVLLVVSFRVVTLNFGSVAFSLLAPAALVAIFVVHFLQKDQSEVVQEALGSSITALNLAMCFLLFCSVIVSYANALDSVSSAFALMRYFVISLLCYFGFVYGYRSEDAFLEKWFLCLFFILNMFAIASLYGIGRVELVDAIKRPVGLVGYSEVMSHLSLFSALFALHIIVSKSVAFSLNWRLFVLCVFLVSIISLFLSSTLKNVLMLGPAMLIIVYFSGYSLKRIWYLSLFVGVVLFPVFLYMGGATIERIHSTLTAGIDFGIQEGDVVESSLAFRVLHWKLLLDDWYQNYFYFGSGIENVPNMAGFGHYQGFRLDAHSDVIKLICELGLVGIAAFLILYFRLFLYLHAMRKDNATAVFCLATIITFSIIASTGKVFFSAFNLYFLSILIGAAFGRERRLMKARLCAE